MSIKRSFSLVVTLMIGMILTGAASIIFAWIGPTQTAPNGNVAAPINVGSTAQIKNGSIGVNAPFVVYDPNSVATWFSVCAVGACLGNVGISTTTPSKTLSVNGDVLVNGNVYAAGYFHTSDARLKINIQTIDSGIISKLRGVTFNWKSDGTPSAGVIAQEVEAVMPSAVHTDANGMKSVEYDQLIAPLIEAVKAQQIEIDNLKNEISALKNLQ